MDACSSSSIGKAHFLLWILPWTTGLSKSFHLLEFKCSAWLTELLWIWGTSRGNTSTILIANVYLMLMCQEYAKYLNYILSFSSSPQPLEFTTINNLSRKPEPILSHCSCHTFTPHQVGQLVLVSQRLSKCSQENSKVSGTLRNSEQIRMVASLSLPLPTALLHTHTH